MFDLSIESRCRFLQIVGTSVLPAQNVGVFRKEAGRDKNNAFLNGAKVSRAICCPSLIFALDIKSANCEPPRGIG